MAKYQRSLDVRAVQLKALANGGRIRYNADGTPTKTVEWDVSGNCQSSVSVELHGRAEIMIGNNTIEVSRGVNTPNFCAMQVRCRKCPNCLKVRGAQWRYRAMSEWRNSNRTWLATLTINPENLAHSLHVVRAGLSKQGVDYEALPVDEQFRLLDKTVFGEIQQWLKRVRKNSGKTIRYLCITEAHKSGVPHWHLLIHEPDTPLRYDADLKGSWGMGFSSFKLVRDAAGAGYVTKYLSKAIGSQVRASLAYGKSSDGVKERERGATDWNAASSGNERSESGKSHP